MSSKKMVYVIHGDMTLCEAVCAFLKSENYDVQTFNSVQTFLAASWIENSCVLMETDMPEMKSLELLASSKARGVNLAVIVISTYFDVSIAVKAMKLGAFELIEAPFLPETLLQVIRSASACASSATGDAHR
jgi:FixJ family two-component response regulator